MKTLVAVVSVAVLAILLVEIAQSDARRGEKKCPADKRPALNTTETKCDPKLGPALKCSKTCTDCYQREVLLQRLPGCVVNGTCTCLAKPSNATATTPLPTTETEAP